MSLTDDPSTQAWLDQEDTRVAQTIRRHGTFKQFVMGDSPQRRPPFAYTMDLFGLGHPELLVIGAGIGTAGHILNEVAGRVRAGHDLVPGDIVVFDGWSPRAFVDVVPDPGEIVFTVNRFYQRPHEHSVDVHPLALDDV